MLPIGLYAEIACIWEVTARKPGNVHRERDFADVGLIDFLLSAAAIAPVMDRAAGRPVGETILESVQATRRVVTTNTNLGMILLLAPLAAVPEGDDLRAGVGRVLNQLGVADSLAVFEAIRLAQPGGLGTAPEQDVHDRPTLPLREIMALAAQRDLIARQYANGFAEVFDDGVPALTKGLEKSGDLENAIICTHLCLLAHHPDSLIVRKRGAAEAEEASQRAQVVLDAGWPDQSQGKRAIGELDAWLRTEGRGRNPGTTADLVTASLFAALCQGIIALPLARPWCDLSAASTANKAGPRPGECRHP